MIAELKKPSDLSIDVVSCESGFFIMIDITKCKNQIPARFRETHDYEDPSDPAPVLKNKVYMEDGRIPLDLAFCRWMAVERKVIMMPTSLFYNPSSPFRVDNLVRVCICKTLDHQIKAAQRIIGHA